MVRGILCLLLLWIVLPVPVAVAAVTATPLILDATVAPRDIFQRTVVIVNEATVPTRVFPSINEIVLDEGGAIKDFVAASMGDQTTAITSWISFPRGRIELPPGASTTLTVSFAINPNARPGLYHAYLGFGTGSNRDEAESLVRRGQSGGVIVRIAVADTRVESLRLARTSIERLVIQSAPEAITYTLFNPGDVPITPSGEVILYNSRGEETGSMPLNLEGQTIPPGETVDLTAPLTTTGLFGKYKAFLNLEYGTNRATVHDATVFYVAPWYYLAPLFAGILVVFLFVLFWWRRVLIPSEADNHDGHVTMIVRPGTQESVSDHDITLSKTPPKP